MVYDPCDEPYHFPSHFTEENKKAFEKFRHIDFSTYDDIENVLNKDILHQCFLDVAYDDLVVKMLQSRKRKGGVKISLLSRVGKEFNAHREELTETLENNDWEVIETPMSFKIIPKK